jgi:ABC-type sugar transport system substrate-binding protein
VSRVHQVRLPVSLMFALCVTAAIAPAVLLYALDVEVGLALAVAGLLLAIFIPFGIEYRSRAYRPRRVVIVDYRAHQFGHAVARGAMRTLNLDPREWIVEYKTPDEAEGDTVAWQVRQIQAGVIDDVDGMVVIPAADDRDLWFALATAIKARIFVVAVDTKPPNTVFRNIGIEPPRFVSSRYSVSGEVIGRLLVDWMRADADTTAVLWTGPKHSFPGEERSRNILFHIADADLLRRTTLLPLDSWAPSSEQCRRTLKLVQDAPGRVAVYCADDENAMALHYMTLAENVPLRDKMLIVGCNANPDDWGQVPAVSMHAVDATVDILAEEQGVQTAMLMIKERNGKLPGSERTVFITPELVRPSDESTWLDAFFPSERRLPGSPETSTTIIQDEHGRVVTETQADASSDLGSNT